MGLDIHASVRGIKNESYNTTDKNILIKSTGQEKTTVSCNHKENLITINFDFFSRKVIDVHASIVQKRYCVVLSTVEGLHIGYRRQISIVLAIWFKQLESPSSLCAMCLVYFISQDFILLPSCYVSLSPSS